MSRSQDTSNSHSPAETSGHLDNPAPTAVNEYQDLNPPTDTPLNDALGDSPPHTLVGHDEPTADDVTSDDRAVTSDDRAVISLSEELTNSDDAKEKSSELSDFSDDDVITEIGNGVVKLTLPVKNV